MSETGTIKAKISLPADEPVGTPAHHRQFGYGRALVLVPPLQLRPAEAERRFPREVESREVAVEAEHAQQID